MTSNCLFLVSIAASVALALDAPCQSGGFAVSLTNSATSCKLTASFSGPPNGTAILFAGPTGGKPVSLPFGTLYLTKGLVRVQAIKLSSTGTAKVAFKFPNSLTVGLQAALIDAQGKLTGLSSYGAVTLQRSKSGAALAGAWTTPQIASPRLQLAVEAGPKQKIVLRAGTTSTVIGATLSYFAQRKFWLVRVISSLDLIGVYVDGVLWGYIEK